jgi:rubredoxin
VADIAIFECNLCGYVYDEEQEGKPWDELPDDWDCPVFGSPKSEFSLVEQEVVAEVPLSEPEEQSTDDYPAEWARHSDDLEIHMADIHRMAVTGQSVIEPMRTGAPTFSWDELLIKGAQLAKIPLNEADPVKTQEEYLKRVDAIEIKIGQAVKPGMGGHLPGTKVTKEIAQVRGFPKGIDIISPAHFDDIQTK